MSAAREFTTVWDSFELPGEKPAITEPDYWRPGDLVRVRTHPLKDGRPTGSLRGIIKSDGSGYRNTEGLEPPSTE